MGRVKDQEQPIDGKQVFGLILLVVNKRGVILGLILDETLGCFVGDDMVLVGLKVGGEVYSASSSRLHRGSDLLLEKITFLFFLSIHPPSPSISASFSLLLHCNPSRFLSAALFLHPAVQIAGFSSWHCTYGQSE